jgi:hypothetical protein
MQYDNPSARLHALLTAGLKIDRNTACVTAWAEIFGVSPNDSSSLFSALGKAMALPAETAALVSKYYPALEGANEHWRGPLEAAFFNQQIVGKWETFIVHVNPYCISQLATLGELLNVRIGHAMAESEAVTNLNSSLDQLIQEVEAAELPSEVKLHLLRELLNLRACLSEYRVTGSMPAIRQAEAIVGHMHRDKGFFDFMTSHDVGKRVLDNLNAVVGVLTVVVSVSQIAAPTFALLPK